MDKESENLKELFETFLDREDSDRSVEEVSEGERIISEHPAPEPDWKLVSDIKAKVAVELGRRKRVSFKKVLYRAVAIAAAFIIFASVSVKIFETESFVPSASATVIPNAVWDSDDIAEADDELVVLTAELEEVRDEMLVLQLGEDETNGTDFVTDLEIELTEINSDFWKG